MLNKVILQGRLVADPELRHTQSNIPVASFRIAVDRDYKSQNGDREADFINIAAWRGAAEFVSRSFTKGRMIVVEGRLQVRNYTDRDGNRRYATEVVADNLYFGDSRRDSQPTAKGGYEPAQASNDADANRYAPPPNYGAPGSGAAMSEFAELKDDDGELPF